MKGKTPIWLSWSSGKDSAWTLKTLREDPRYEVRALLTTVNETHERVAMHAVRRELLRAQAAALGIPLIEAPIPYPCSNEIYEEVMGGLVRRARAEGIEAMAFGDLFLEDIRRYREERLEGTGIAPLFPIWGLDTRELAEAMIEAGLEAIITAVDPKQIGPDFVGRSFDRAFLADLPASADPCGENGEFHSFVHAGPGFSRPLDVRRAERVERDGFHFCDLVFAGAADDPDEESP